jgi:hypothetical protein
VKEINQSLEIFRMSGKFKKAKNAREAGNFQQWKRLTFNQKNSRVPTVESVLLDAEKAQKRRC